MSADITVLAANHANDHVQGIIQIHKSEFPPYPNLFRVGCSCGRYKGCWQSSPQLAFASHARHVNGARVEFR
jgi:hypothetical protein